MIYTRRDPWASLWKEFGQFQSEMNRLFGAGNGRNFSPGSPLVNVWEDEENVYAETDLPGVSIDKLEIYVQEGDQLAIKGERTAPEVENAVWHRQERFWGNFTRSVTLPVVVDPDKVEATLENGVLRVVLPKSEAVKPRKIAIKAG